MDSMFFYAALPIAGLFGCAAWIRQQLIKARRRTAEINAAHRIIDNLVQEHWLLLSEADKVLASSLDCVQTIRSVAHMSVPSLADFCCVHAPKCGENYSDLHVSTDPDEDGAWTEALEQVQRTGRSRLVNDEGRGQFGIVLPLLGREATIGALALGRSERKFGKFEVDLARQIGTRVTLAIENAKLYQEAQASALARKDLVDMVSHDIKNPLTSIDLQASFLLRVLGEQSSADPRVGKGIEHIRTSVKRIQRMIEDLLDVTRIEAGRFVVQKAEISVALLLQELTETMSALAQQKAIALSVELHDPAAQMFAEKDRILQVLLNLVGNSLKFTPQGGRVIVKTAEIGNELQISVKDTGIGIDEKHIEHIFDRFWQGRTETARSSAGLGLAISKGIVEAHGGRIWVNSKLGKGSIFTMAFPRR